MLETLPVGLPLFNLYQKNGLISEIETEEPQNVFLSG